MCARTSGQREELAGAPFFLYEQYVDVAGYQAHMDSEHFTRLGKEEAIPRLLESRERAFYVTLD